MKPIKIKVEKIDDSSIFRQAAINFEKNGYYTAAPKGTTAYKDFWAEETERCIWGYTADNGQHITGYNYFYLNYSPIIINKRVTYTNKRGDTLSKVIRERGFPRFHDYDRSFFNILETAEDNGKHLAVLKKRASGYSFKCASMLARNFFLIPESTSIAYASEAEYLVKDGILTKCWDMIDFINENTAWSKKMQKTNTKMHKRASFIVDKNGVLVEMGYKSEIIGVSLKNDPQKARGKRAKLILFEEGGNFPNIKTAWQIARPSVEIGSNAFGTMIVFGTGGTEGANFEGLQQIFYEPEGYNCLPIENIWDDGATDPCGFFVPEYYNMEGENQEGESFMDENGNSKIILARNYSIEQRKIMESKTTDKTAVDRYAAEHPLTPQEACMQLSGNIFPKQDLIRQLAFIRTNTSVKDYKQVGELYYDNTGKVKWDLNPRLKDLTRYHLDRNDDPKGAVVIWEHPVENPPFGLYIAGCDPYDHDKSGTNSLGSVYIYKRFQDFESYYDILVAEYTGRPSTADEFYEVVRKLSIYYNARVLYENQWPGLHTYFKNKHCDYMLADQPDVISKIIKDSKVTRTKGIHMSKEIKAFGELKLRDWLNEEKAPGKKNLQFIMSEALLEELINYNEEGNFDRVIALMMIMIYKEELYNYRVKRREENNRNKLLFPDGLHFKSNDKNLYFL